jgi:hypothetical protein
MKRYFEWFCLILFCVSCSRTVPKNIIDQDKMQDVLTDVLLAEGFTENFLLLDTSKKRDEWLAGEYSKVMAIHQITQDQFRKSLDYYKSKPDEFKIIIDSVNQRGLRNRDESYQTGGKKKKKLKLE